MDEAPTLEDIFDDIFNDDSGSSSENVQYEALNGEENDENLIVLGVGASGANGEASLGIGSASSDTSNTFLIPTHDTSRESSEMLIAPLIDDSDSLASAVLVIGAPVTSGTQTATTASNVPTSVGSIFTVTTSGTTFTTVNHTINEDDVQRRKRPRESPTSRPTSGPPMLNMDIEMTPFPIFGPFALRPQLPPPVIMPRGVSMVPYGQLEALNNRLNKIWAERDGLQGELEEQGKEVYALREKNRNLLGENLLLKQHQAKLLDIVDKKTLMVEAMKNHMGLLEMINKKSKHSKTTRDVGTGVNEREIPYKSGAGTSVNDQEIPYKSGAGTSVTDQEIPYKSGRMYFSKGSENTETNKDTLFGGRIPEQVADFVEKQEAADLVNEFIVDLIRESSTSLLAQDQEKSTQVMSRVRKESSTSLLAQEKICNVEEQAKRLVSIVLKSAVELFKKDAKEPQECVNTVKSDDGFVIINHEDIPDSIKEHFASPAGVTLEISKSPENMKNAQNREKVANPRAYSPTCTKEASVHCTLGDVSPCRVSVSNASTQTYYTVDSPSVRSESRLRSFICCRR